MTPPDRDAALQRLIQTERASQSIARVTPVLVVLFAGMAIAFALIPGGQRSAVIIAGFSVVTVAGYYLNRRGRNRLAAALLVSLLVVAPAIEPLATGDLSTNTAFAGILGVLALMVSEWRYRWWLLAAVVVVTTATILRTDPAETAPVTHLGAAVSGTALLVLSLVVGTWLLNSYRSMIHQAARAQQVAQTRARELDEVNSGLAAAVAQREVELAAAIEARRRLADQLAEATVRDPLTGLHNRHHLDEQLRTLAAPGMAAALLDVDMFKRINDTHSYAVGDRVLQELAQTLRTVVLPPALLARYGGEEFAVLLPDTTPAEARAVAERLRTAVAEHAWEAIQPGLTVTVSVGVCAADSGAVGHPEPAALLRCADRALAQAKGSGRNRTVVVTCNAA